ncbi:ADP-heptose--LPS heptosyltransferase 2 [bacterium BMS3Bbin04]|nr:ADP-heptose--LPS heptosyltransferase 2 [bacterium BMS3Bbin04]
MRSQHTGILQLARFGDLIQTSPLIQQVKRMRPNASICLFVDARTKAAAEIIDGVDEIVPIDLSRRPWPVKASLAQQTLDSLEWQKSFADRDPLDKLIILNQDPISGAIGELIPATERRGPRLRCVLPAPHRYLTLAVQDRKYNPIHLCEIWAAYSGNRNPVPSPILANNALGTGFAMIEGRDRPSSMKFKRFAINMGAKAAGRRPPWEKLAEIASQLLDSGDCRIVLLGMDEDRASAMKMIRSMPESQRERIIDLCGETTLQDLPGVLSGCDVLISSDTGTLQLASATGTRCIGLFMAGANPVETGPYAENAIAVVRRDTLDFNEQQRDDLNDLPVRTIVSIASNLANREEPDGRNIDASNAFAVLVARPDAVGIRYSPLNKEDSVPLGQGERWLPYLRRLINHEAFRPSGEQVLRAELDEQQLDVLERLIARPDTACTGEERWLGSIAQAFVRETMGLLNAKHESAKLHRS